MGDCLLEYLTGKELSIRETWQKLHDIPEPGFMEHLTAAYLADRLEKVGYSTKTGLGGTGVIGTLSSTSDNTGPTVGLRADMDALCHEVDGQMKVIHSCGHDANCTMVLSVAEAVAACGGPLRGTFKVIFQPAEEGLGGAKAMIKTGELDDLNYLMGVHLRPGDELPFGRVITSVRHGASGRITAFLKGKPAHGAKPHQGINAVETACMAVVSVRGIKLDPQVPHSVKATMIKGGGTSLNVIPDSSEVVFDLRAQTNNLMEELKAKVLATLNSVALLNGAQVTTNWKVGGHAAEDHPEMLKIAEEAIREVLGEEAVSGPYISSAGEDFHDYAQAIKGLKTTVVGIGANVRPGLHQPTMNFNLDALLVGAKVLATMVKKLLINK